jgi:serine/threonine protein phosphatase 1
VSGVFYAIGDIHGHALKLHQLLVQLSAAGMTDEDTLVFLGDYVDRGPDTREVLDTLIHLRETHPNAVFLRGNHEQMMLDARARYDPTWARSANADSLDRDVHWFAVGGAQTLQSYRDAGAKPDGRWWSLVPESHWQFMVDSRMELITDRFHFVHAGVLPDGEDWEYADLGVDPRLWIREPFLSSSSDFGGRVVVYGHTPIRSGHPVVRWNQIGLDTGAAYGGPLTAVRLDSDGPYDPASVRIFQAR